MKKLNESVVVASRSFSKHPQLRRELAERYETVVFNDTGRMLSGGDLAALLKGHRKAIIGLEVVDEALLAQLPDLKIIGKHGVGLDKIDFKALDRRGIRFGWTGGVNKRSVSELALGFMIAALRHVPLGTFEIRRGIWNPRSGRLLSGRMVGVVGCGHIGKDLIGLLRPFGCQILANDIRDYRDFYDAHGVKACSLDELLAESDVVTLHVPYDASTKNMISAERLAKMKPGAVLINTARGGLVDEGALKERLKSGALLAAAFDVFAVEPPTDSELVGLPQFLPTPHIGGSAEEAILAMGRAAIEGLENARPAREFLS